MWQPPCEFADFEFGCFRASESALYDMVRGEYSEMPGLSLTVHQAARLWNIEAAACERVLNELVRAGFLVKVRDIYVRAYAGRRSL